MLKSPVTSFDRISGKRELHGYGKIALISLLALTVITTISLLVPGPIAQADATSLQNGQVLASPPYAAASFPSAYDLRALGGVTKVKNQNAGIFEDENMAGGNCWAFAALGSLESCILIADGETWDFSENNMKNLMGKEAPLGWDIDTNSGGNSYEAAAYLMRWSGPVNESDDLYDRNSTYSQGEDNLTVQKRIQNVEWLPPRSNSSDNNAIKWAIMTYGAVDSDVHWGKQYYDKLTFAYYDNNSSDQANHEIDIVGWDDNFNASNFRNTPPGNGAFICKNSWGTRFGDKGYFYVSYYDTVIGNTNAIFEASDSTNNYTNIYQYDPLGISTNGGYNSATGWFANIFTAKSSSETLKAVNWFTAQPNSTYTIYVYLNPASPENPTSGTLQANATTTGTISLKGYHTISLAQPVQLTGSQKFAVVVQLTSPGCDTPIPLETPDNKNTFTSKATA